MNPYRKTIGLLAIAVIVLPIAFKAIVPEQRRSFDRVRLDDVPHEEVSFRNERQGIGLAGLWFRPPTGGPVPAVVVIQGSGPSHRDNGWTLTLAQGLYQRGIAVLLPDKRGSGGSGGDWRSASFDDLATDTLAAIDHLRTVEGIGPIGIVGMSQGGHIAPLVARQSPGLSFVVSMVSSVVPMHELLYYEEVHNLQEFGLLPGLSHALALITTRLIIHGSQRAFWQAIGNHDPLPDWERVQVPGLVLLAGEDTNVPSQRSAERLEGLGKDNLQVVIFEGSGHALESPEGQGNRLIRDDALDAIAALAHAAGSAHQASSSPPPPGPN